MVTLASWCALRFGETVELRRGDIDLSDEVIRIRRAAVRAKGGTYTITTPKSDAGMRDVAIPPHIIPLIEAHLAKYVGTGRDSLIFPAENGGHLQPSTLYRHWYKARDEGGPRRSALARPAALRRGAGRGDRRDPGRTDGPPRAFDTAGRDALPARRAGPRPRDRRAAVQAGRERGGGWLTPGDKFARRLTAHAMTCGNAQTCDDAVCKLCDRMWLWRWTIRFDGLTLLSCSDFDVAAPVKGRQDVRSTASPGVGQW